MGNVTFTGISVSSAASNGTENPCVDHPPYLPQLVLFGRARVWPLALAWVYKHRSYRCLLLTHISIYLLIAFIMYYFISFHCMSTPCHHDNQLHAISEPTSGSTTACGQSSPCKWGRGIGFTISFPFREAGSPPTEDAARVTCSR